ncbi:hypothetical protein SFRURICE_011654 [Spodoptera frugiperda]|nr:hypothetical protein SFRURICE_011654 [Spodoptera frugiperda]
MDRNSFISPTRKGPWIVSSVTMVLMDKVLRTIKTKAWCVLLVCAVAIVMEAAALNGDNVCMVKQKYNITKRVKYRAPMSVRTYEWCFSMPPRCSRWNTEMRDLTRLETEERIAEVAVCCPGYKMRDVSCVPICPNGKTGPGCSEASTKNVFTTIVTLDTKENHRNEMTTTLTKEFPKIVTDYVNTTLVTSSTTKVTKPTTEAVTEKVKIHPINIKTDKLETTTVPIIVIKSAPTANAKPKPIEVLTTTEMPTTVSSTTVETTIKLETSKKETTVKFLPTTIKFKPKEIWIRPAQKGESPIVETKIKTTHEFPRYRSANNNNKELTPTVTTPKTIIVSIIPTSVSYTTFKKIALTSSFVSAKNSSTVQSYNKTEIESTKPMLTETTTPPIKLSPLSRKDLLATSYFINNTLVSSTSVTPKPTTSSTKSTIIVTKSLETKPIPRINRTNSMMTDINKNVSTFITTASFNATRTSLKMNDLLTTSTTTSTTPKPTSVTQSSTEHTTKHLIKYVLPKKVTATTEIKKIKPTTNAPKIDEKEFKKANVTKSFTKVTTEGPADDEEFHILTEPEHITAVMGDKGTERSSVDLISVISIAGGVMMAVITVAVVIVMIERCKKPRYEDVRKINDIRMQVMIDNNDVPPPYVRSIFHTPLPDPPSSEKCHYQPISTLDRNLKQFMRPVVVQTISPIMLENFRGILECHYDHLPRRSHEFNTIQTRSSIAPSMNGCSELRQLRASVTESTIEALKCEAKLDVIDSTTSEPLYAEIPCWRPPSEHAIEIMNLNGEAVTEL